MTAVTAPPSTRELTRFLLARIGDDEAELKRLAKRAGSTNPDGVCSIDRIKADALAKRRTIGVLQQLVVLRDQPFEKAIRDQAAQMLRYLAVPYDSHPGYRPEWRPTAAH